MEVTVFPAHDDLQDPVGLSQRRILPDLDAPPDGRMNVPQRHLELVQDAVLLSHLHQILPIASLRRTQVRPMFRRRAIAAWPRPSSGAGRCRVLLLPPAQVLAVLARLRRACANRSRRISQAKTPSARPVRL